MKKNIFSAISIMIFTLFANSIVFANGMMGDTGTISDGHTAREEAEGKIVWEKLRAKQAACTDLSDDDFGTLGEYFMGQMMGDSHEAMNNMMIQMMGEKNEEQTHIAMGKRLSACLPAGGVDDTSVAIPSQGAGFMPMMQMMTGGWSSPFSKNSTSNMMNLGFGLFGWFGWIFMIPSQGAGFMPMMQMMTGGWSSPFSKNSTSNMMNLGFGLFGWFGWIFMIL